MAAARSQTAPARHHNSFNLSGEIPQVAARISGRGPVKQQSFNLSGEIPQVAARQKEDLLPYWDTFQSLRRDSSSGRGAHAARLRQVRRVSISQARFLKWPLTRNRQPQPLE